MGLPVHLGNMTITHNLAEWLESFMVIPNVGVLPRRGIRFQSTDADPTLASEFNTVNGPQLLISSKVVKLVQSNAGRFPTHYEIVFVGRHVLDSCTAHRIHCSIERAVCPGLRFL